MKKWKSLAVFDNKNVSEKALLTGAGFTANFGAPLATEMWEEIFRHEKVKAEPRVRELMFEEIHYESVYNTIMKGEFTDEEKNAIDLAIKDAYKSIDDILRHCVTNPQYQINIGKVNKLIDHFYHPNKKAFLFTLNQDLFIERKYKGHGLGSPIPGIFFQPEFVVKNMDIPLSDNDYGRMLHEKIMSQEIDANGSQILKGGKFFYIKLHGSQHWLSADGRQLLIIGGGKMQQIRREPLLSWYFEIFKKVLRRHNLHLLIIGYGFRDKHINRIIMESIEKYDLKLVIISPEKKEEFFRGKIGKKVRKGIEIYIECPLWKMFYNNSETRYYRLLRDVYLKRNL